MGFVRLLTILFIAWLLYSVYRRYIKNKSRSGQQRQTPPSKDIEKVVKCEKCAVHIPVQEAIEHKGRYYCSKAHLPADN